MSYLFSGQVSRILNHNYVKLGSRAFVTNYVYLIKNGNQIQQKLNFEYYYAYLDCQVYFIYRHLFGLDSKIRHAGFPMYWYNSVSAINWIRFDQKMYQNGINPVYYLSSCFSSFYYQFVKYHRVYHYRVSELANPLSFSKYIQHTLSSPEWFHYYFSGNPVLDLVARLYNYRFLEFVPINSFVSDIEFDWLSYLNENERLLRMPKLQFRMYFKHDRTELEDRLINSGDWLDIIKLVGVPDDAQAFGFISTRLWSYTCGYQRHLAGLENYLRDRVAIKPYKLYSVDVARGELNKLLGFSRVIKPYTF